MFCSLSFCFGAWEVHHAPKCKPLKAFLVRGALSVLLCSGVALKEPKCIKSASKSASRYPSFLSEPFAWIGHSRSEIKIRHNRPETRQSLCRFPSLVHTKNAD